MLTLRRHASERIQVEVVHLRRRFPWALAGAGAAGALGVYLWRQMQLAEAAAQAQAAAQEAAQHAQQLEAEAAAAKAEAAAAAEAAARAEAAEKAAKAAKAEEAARIEAAKLAAQKAALEAERKAALEATFKKCAQLLNEAKLVEDSADYYTTADAHDEELLSLLSNLQAFVAGDTFQRLQESHGEKSQMANRLLSSLDFLKLFVDRLQKAEDWEKQFDTATAAIRSERRRWLAGETADLSVMQSALVQAEQALFELHEADIECDALDDVVATARSNLKEMQDEEERRRAREAAGEALEAAMDSLDAQVCRKTLEDARVAGCYPSAELEIARQVAELGESTPESTPSSGFSKQEMESAALDAIQTMSTEELREHVAQLAEAVAAQYQLESLEVSSSLIALKPEWERQSQVKADKAHLEFRKGKELGKQGLEMELKDTAALHLREALQEAVEEVQEQSDRKIYELQSSMMLQLQEDLAQAVKSFESQLDGMPEIFSSQLRELWKQGQCPQHMVSVASRSATTALKGGQLSSTEDLQLAFQRVLPDLLASAFEPRVGWGSRLIGRLLGGLYRLRGEQEELSMRKLLEERIGELPLDESHLVRILFDFS